MTKNIKIFKKNKKNGFFQKFELNIMLIFTKKSTAIYLFLGKHLYILIFKPI